MQIVGTQVHSEAGRRGAFTVEFVGDHGEVISVRLAGDGGGRRNRMNAVDEARSLLADVAATRGALPEMDDEKMRVLRSAREAGDALALEEELEAGLLGSFPASDPASATTSTIPAGRAGKRAAKKD